MDINLSFSTRCGGDFGTTIIDGFVFPHTTFNPLAKIWASVRKQNFKIFGTDVAGVFTYDNEQRQISCLFYLSYANQEGNEKNHLKSFQNTFDVQIERFVKAILDFIKDDTNGYSRYLLLTQTGASDDEINEMFNLHLASTGLRPSKK